MATKASIQQIVSGNRRNYLQFKALGTTKNFRNFRIFWHKIR
jgi:hypothetical protein